MKLYIIGGGSYKIVVEDSQDEEDVRYMCEVDDDVEITEQEVTLEEVIKQVSIGSWWISPEAKRQVNMSKK